MWVWRQRQTRYSSSFWININIKDNWFSKQHMHAIDYFLMGYRETSSSPTVYYTKVLTGKWNVATIISGTVVVVRISNFNLFDWNYRKNSSNHCQKPSTFLCADRTFLAVGISYFVPDISHILVHKKALQKYHFRIQYLHFFGVTKTKTLTCLLCRHALDTSYLIYLIY